MLLWLYISLCKKWLKIGQAARIRGLARIYEKVNCRRIERILRRRLQDSPTHILTVSCGIWVKGLDYFDVIWKGVLIYNSYQILNPGKEFLLWIRFYVFLWEQLCFARLKSRPKARPTFLAPPHINRKQPLESQTRVPTPNRELVWPTLLPGRRSKRRFRRPTRLCPVPLRKGRQILCPVNPVQKSAKGMNHFTSPSEENGLFRLGLNWRI